MRTLKFRAYDSATGKVSEPFDVKESWGDYLIDFEDYSTDGALDSIIWEQFTGLLDRNGKEIYEGDIVKNIEGINETAVCVWDESNAEFDFRCKDGRYTRDNVKSWLEMYEVIGNIHEKSELLEDENGKN